MANLADCNRQITELIYILKAEIKSLKNGEFHNLNQTAILKAEKSSAVEILLKTLIDTHKTKDPTILKQQRALLAPQLARLKSLSVESGVILQAIFTGLKSAQNRIWILQNANTLVGAYGRQGQSLSFGEEPVSQEKSF